MRKQEGDEGSAEARAGLLRALADLAEDVAQRFRARRDPRTRDRGELLVTRRAVLLALATAAAASAVACGPGNGQSVAFASPLNREVSVNLPTHPGQYEVDPNSVARDDQGVYSFAWRSSSSGPWTYASASDLRLYPADRAMLEIAAGQSPTLYLPRNATVSLLGTQNGVTYGNGTGYSWHTYPYYSSRSYGWIGPWHPFSGSSTPSRPSYYSPPRSVSTGGTIEGGSVSDHAPSFSSRTIGLTHAVSGRLGGTGAGNAVTSKSGASTSSSSRSSPISSFFSSGHGSSGGSSGG
ncbi:MAG TPA: hypothetical protein VFZ25_05945 [Chloroflexota bacterium]|nr:hypothetical protein [Chloroflexota bacterium]